jgi:hypothetical protein
VEATLRDNKIKQGIAFNAELLILDDEMRPFGDPYADFEKLSETSSAEIKALRALPRVASTGLTEAIRALQKKEGPAKDAPIKKTGAHEVFRRFSAYWNDRRVAPDGRLLPGSYATTEDDAKHVRTGQEAVARYALPNPKPASYRFAIRPHEDTDIQQGVAEPANGQPSGGVEVIFAKGTQEGTVHGPDKIPDKQDADKTRTTVDESASRTAGVRDGVSKR